MLPLRVCAFSLLPTTESQRGHKASGHDCQGIPRRASLLWPTPFARCGGILTLCRRRPTIESPPDPVPGRNGMVASCQANGRRIAVLGFILLSSLSSGCQGLETHHAVTSY